MRPIMLDCPLPIRTPRLLLRQPIMGYVDAYDYVKAIEESLPELRQWLPWAQQCPTVGQAEEYIRDCCANWILKTNNNVGLSVWIIDRVSGNLVGHISIWNILWELPKFELGFWLRSSLVGQGYITEAVNAVTRYCFTQLRARRVEIRCEAANYKAQAVAQRLGFSTEGVLEQSALAAASGCCTDVVLLACTNPSQLPPIELHWDP